MSASSHAIVGGTGAVGSVYAYHLQKGGADVTLYVREKYAEALKAKGGRLVLHDLNARLWVVLACKVVTFFIVYNGTSFLPCYSKWQSFMHKYYSIIRFLCPVYIQCFISRP